MTVKVTALNQVKLPVSDPADPSNNESSIGANDFNYGRGEGVLTADKANELGNVIAKDKDGNHILLDQVTVDKEQLKAINNALENGKFGKILLTYTEPDGKSMTINVTIFDHMAHNPDPDNKQEIGGNDFKYDIQDGKLTDDKAKELAKVYAKNQLRIDIPADQIYVNQNDLDKINEAIKNSETGEFKLRFTTDDGQELSVTVTLLNGKVVDPTDVKTPSEKRRKSLWLQKHG